MQETGSKPASGFALLRTTDNQRANEAMSQEDAGHLLRKRQDCVAHTLRGQETRHVSNRRSGAEAQSLPFLIGHVLALHDCVGGVARRGYVTVRPPGTGGPAGWSV